MLELVARFICQLYDLFLATQVMEIIRHQKLSVIRKLNRKAFISRSVPPKLTKTGINSENVELPPN